MLAVRYRHTRNSVLGRVVHSIHEEGQKRHTKVNGEGSLNACGSEGSPSHGACSSSDPVERVDESRGWSWIVYPQMLAEENNELKRHLDAL